MVEQNESTQTISDKIEQNQDDLERIKNEVNKEHGTSKLRINRVPDETVEKFKELAASKMANDYGLTLAYLLEINDLKDQFDQQLAATSQKVVELQSEVQALRQELAEQDTDENDDSKVDTIG